MSHFHIRKAGIDDFESIFQLLQEFFLFQKTPEKLTITPAQMKEDKDIFYYILAETKEHDIAGFITFFPGYYSWSGKAIYVDDMYVMPAFRNQGIGKRLLQSVIQKAGEEECKKVRWQVFEWNTSAIHFYKRIGAVIDDTERNCDLIL